MTGLFEQQTLSIISLWQPYASLFFTQPQLKIHETRGFAYPPRLMGQRIGIHAAQKVMPRAYMSDQLEALCREVFGSDWRKTIPGGALLGTVELGRCKPTNNFIPASPIDRLAGDWSHGRFAWEGLDPQALAAPMTMRGKQGWWSIPMVELPR